MFGIIPHCMRTPAIQLAFQLAKQPEEMKWLTLAKTPLPTGITDLLRLCASAKRLEKFTNKININTITIRKILVNFIEKVLVNEKNSPEKILGLEADYQTKTLKLHYQLLMRIFHPDLSISKQSSHKTSLLSEAYRELKSRQEEPQQFKNITLSRVPPKSFYYATKNAEIHHSGLKNTFIVFAGMGLISLGIILNYLLESSKPELIVNTQQAIQAPKKQAPTEIPTANIKSPANRLNIAKANFSVLDKARDTDTILQMILRDIETYYENGNVQRIKPILANTPEMRSQSDAQMQAKLENLFNITQQRKMLLYNFKWQNISGKIKGVGKFISRYQLVDQSDQLNWQIREGIATVTAEEINNNFSVTGLQLENNITE